jgi:hypothetical protein
MRRPRADDVELIAGLIAGAFLAWAYDYPTVAVWVLGVGAVSYVIALLEG